MMMLIIGNVGGGMWDVGCAMLDVGGKIVDFGLRNCKRLELGLKMKFGHGF